MPSNSFHINESDLEWTNISRGDRFEHRHKSLARATEGEKLGCRLHEIPPGKRAWPRHAHLGNEEALFILDGQGTLIRGDRERTVKRGDYVVFPAGPDHPHQLINTSEETLRYLCISTMREPDVILYPDSEKFGVIAGSAPGGDREQRSFKGFFNQDSQRDYWEGET